MSQNEYILILFNDCGFNLKSRNAWLSLTFKKEIHFIDDITRAEKSQVIEKLKAIKESNRHESRRLPSSSV